MLNESLVKQINFQINKELESAYIYLDFANYFSERGLTGFEHWYKVQAREEIEHAERFIDFLHNENESVTLSPIDMVRHPYSSDLEVLENGLNHEVYVTELINLLYAEAEKACDYRLLRFLDWFITEQAEEEKNANELITNYLMFAKDCKMGLCHLDKELGER